MKYKSHWTWAAFCCAWCAFF